MSWSDLLNAPFWDVFPKRIKVSVSDAERTIPLSIRGGGASAPEFVSAETRIARVDASGVVHLGLQAGSTLIMVYDSPERGSVRYVEVEVAGPSAPGLPVWLAWEETS